MTAQRRLGDATRQLADSYKRLSSGLRINKPSDDAAGLSISTSFSTDSRVYATGIRNLNDGISLLSIAEGSLMELRNVVTRIQELAIQSSNGTLGRTQRLALQAEVNALTNEYNRIANSTTFNGLSLLDGSFTDLVLQAGYGSDGSLNLSLGKQLGIQANTGTFSTNQTFAVGNAQGGVTTGDFNGDGLMDFSALVLTSSQVATFLGNGDGSFRAPILSSGGGIFAQTGDFNRDGRLDIVSSGFTTNVVGISLGNGDGSFQTSVLYPGGTSVIEAIPVDMNGDGILDIVASSYPDMRISVFIGNGDGTFKARRSYNSISNISHSVGDVNNDGVTDVITTTGSGIGVMLGNSDGSLRSVTPYNNGVSAGYITTGDLNYDGVLDVVATGIGTGMQVFMGNADGSFRTATSYTILANSLSPRLKDFNGDGFVDLFAAADTAGGGFSLLFGNGDGTFKAYTTASVGANTFQAAAADFNNDGSIEVVTASTGSNNVFLFRPDTTLYTGLARVNIASEDSARESLEILVRAGRRLSLELGLIGAQQSRIDSARSNMSQMRLEYDRAVSQINDVDVAEESSRLVRLSILQNAAQGVLVQANLVPDLALRLISGS